MALTSASAVHAARGPSPLTVRLIVGHGAGVSGEPRPGRPMLQEVEDVSWMAGCRPDAWRPGVIRGRRKGASPGSIQRAGLRQAVRPPERRGGARQCVPGRRGAARCGFPACPHPVPPSRWV